MPAEGRLKIFLADFQKEVSDFFTKTLTFAALL
jgi:hypothetical protein